MGRHLLRLIWKRKTRHLLLTLELALAFALIFPLAAFTARGLQLMRLPLGFDVEAVWAVQLQPGDPAKARRDTELLDRFKREIQALPQVQQAALISYAPYTDSEFRTQFARPGERGLVTSQVLTASDELFETLGLALRQGRGFGRADAGGGDTPVVVNQAMATELAPTGSAVGLRFSAGEPGPEGLRWFRVTGVVDAYRDRGELMSPAPFILMRHAGQAGGDPPLQLVLRLKPGTPRGFEAVLNQRLRQIRGDWSYTITPLAELRAQKLRAVAIMWTALAVPAAFVLLMVAFGLFGVLWQSVALRTQEIGLRRAVGASAGQVYRQIVAEQLLLGSLAMALALALLIQIPLTGLWSADLNWSVFAAAALASAGVIYAISLLCALLPAWQASRVAPAAALRGE